MPEYEPALIGSLFQGIFERPLWATFLERLRRSTGADSVVLIFHPPSRRLEEALHLTAGETSAAQIEELFRQHSPTFNLPPAILAEERPYSLKELFGSYVPDQEKFFRKLLDRYGVTAIRQMRVREMTGVDAWLTISRRGEDFTVHEEALLRAIAPMLRGVLGIYVTMERERFAASLTAEAIRRLQFGWLTLDREGRVVDADDQGVLVLTRSGVLSRSATGRLTASSKALEAEIYQALGRVAETPLSRPRAIILNHEPWLDMLLVPVRGRSFSSKPMPAAIAYVHGDSWRSADRCEQLAELFALTPSEARLALALSRGMTIAEAASEFGLTAGSARIYSKRIYAKTGARGLPDLVRIIMRSVLAVGPEA